MKKFIIGIITASLLLSSSISSAHEGMWLPMLIKRLNIAEMQSNGLNLTAEELYDINNASIKDAIVSLGGFCTGEIISDKGLMLTNHHCGYDAIRSHSTIENDYLSDGFWAMTPDEERFNPGLTAAILVRMEDVTDKILAELSDDMTEAERARKAKEIGDALAKEATSGTKHNAYVRSFFHNNEFYLFVFNTYNDVRLVGAPPSSIGKFGGDTDNWMWPRHTGDFSLFRIYADENGNPSDISDGNIPLNPRHHLPISLSGVKEGDFSMVFGFPGSTDRFLTSTGIDQAINLYNPTVVEIRDEKLAIMKRAMDSDESVRIALASNYASTANYWKYYIGQTEQLKKNQVKQKKEGIEAKYLAWAKSHDSLADYADALNLLDEAYSATDKTVKSDVYLMEAGIRGASLPLFAFRLNRMLSALPTSEDLDLDKQDILDYAESHFSEFQLDVDKDLAAALWKMWVKNIPADQLPSIFMDMRNAMTIVDMNNLSSIQPSKGMVINIPNIYFDVARSSLRNDSKTALDTLFSILKKNPNITISLRSHTDYRGSDENNELLSQKRAQSCVDYLINKGIDEERLTASGMGESQPFKVPVNYKGLGSSLFEQGESLTEEYILNLSKEDQKVANQINRRTDFTVLSDDFGDIDEANDSQKMNTNSPVANNSVIDFDAVIDAMVDDIYNKSIFASLNNLKAWLEGMDEDVLSEDPGAKLASNFIMTYYSRREGDKDVSEKMSKGYRLYADGLRKAFPEKIFYPDANSTPRMSWGLVGSYEPQDGKRYNYITTLDGVMQKENPNDEEFIVPTRLKQLWASNDYGPYADENGKLVVNFISNNDITGGNSGSPVINGDGHLIGTAFDGNWEAMSGDIFFEDELQRTISVDIRYILFLIDKYAGAKHLVDEMTIIEDDKSEPKSRTFDTNDFAFWKKEREYSDRAVSINTSGPIPAFGISYDHQVNPQLTLSAFYSRSRGVDVTRYDVALSRTVLGDFTGQFCEDGSWAAVGANYRPIKNFDAFRIVAAYGVGSLRGKITNQATGVKYICDGGGPWMFTGIGLGNRPVKGLRLGVDVGLIETGGWKVTTRTINDQTIVNTYRLIDVLPRRLPNLQFTMGWGF